MKLHRPFEALTPTLDGDVLLVLAGAETSFTGGQLARMIPHASEDGVRRAAKRLAAQGVVRVERVGQAHNYSLNRDHLLAGPITSIAQARRRFGERVRRHVDNWRTAPEVVVLFGSAARNGMLPTSDIDLLVVGDGDERWEDQLSNLEQEVHRWTGNDARILTMTMAEVAAAGDTAPILRDIEREGQILWGPPGWLHELRRSRRPDGTART